MMSWSGLKLRAVHFNLMAYNSAKLELSLTSLRHVNNVKIGVGLHASRLFSHSMAMLLIKTVSCKRSMGASMTSLPQVCRSPTPSMAFGLAGC